MPSPHLFRDVQRLQEGLLLNFRKQLNQRFKIIRGGSLKAIQVIATNIPVNNQRKPARAKNISDDNARDAPVSILERVYLGKSVVQPRAFHLRRHLRFDVLCVHVDQPLHIRLNVFGRTLLVHVPVRARWIVRQFLPLSPLQGGFDGPARTVYRMNGMLASHQLLMELPDVGIGLRPSIRDELENTFQGTFMVLEYRDDFLGRFVRDPVRYEARFDPLLDQ